ncbi:MAG: RecQ family ATP-dependent DNA helicase [Treponema sp.]|jgi:ATP-dependent DNA helicase RecQ|nr:RecQ family ATP-dependent DNA helicase [Treponema sp.]
MDHLDGEIPSGPGEPDLLTKAAKEYFGLSYLFPYQRLTISNILEAAAGEGEDSGSLGRQIVILPTGAGKSLCFQLPAMLLPGPTLVLYPILSLMADQERRLRERGFSPVMLRGGQTAEEREGIWRRVKSGESRFIIANPEVLLTERTAPRLGELGIAHLVIDEAHCISEWGESFRPSYLRIGEIIKAAGNRPAGEAPGGKLLVTAFTATASAPVLEKIEAAVFGGLGARRIIGNPDRSNIIYSGRGSVLKDLAVRDLLREYERPAIVFCSSRRGTERTAAFLRDRLSAGGLPGELRLEDLAREEIRFYHAGLSREEKTAVENWFFSSKRGVLTATCAYGMGVDKGDIRTVIHRDAPPSVEAYLQESGRAGRDGLASRAILLWGPEDRSSLKRVEGKTGEGRLRALLSYGRDTGNCRREALLRLLDYEGNEGNGEKPAGNAPEQICCDVCGGEVKEGLREEASLVEFFGKHRRFFTLAEAAALLAEAPSLHWSAEEAREVCAELIRQGKLRVIKSPLWKGRITINRQDGRTKKAAREFVTLRA